MLTEHKELEVQGRSGYLTADYPFTTVGPRMSFETMQPGSYESMRRGGTATVAIVVLDVPKATEYF